MEITCKRCGETKNETEFHIQKSNSTGRQSSCKKCEYIKTMTPVKAHEMDNQDVVDGFKTVMKVLGYDTSSDISEQFKQRVKKKYGVILD